MAFKDYLPWNAMRDFNDLVDDYFIYQSIKPETTISHKFDYYGNRRRQGVEPAYKEPVVSDVVLKAISDSPFGQWLSTSPLVQDLTALGQKVAHYVTGKGENPDLSQLNILNDSGQTSSYVPSSSSASGVSSGSVEGSIFSDYAKYLNYLKEINNSNNAFNIEQAQKQMDFQAEQNKILMDFNAEEALKSRNWQEYMSNTAHQREQADLKAAGLNPILAVSGGNGAAIGSGVAASAGGAPSGARVTADNVFASAILSMFNSAMDVAEKNASAAITANAVAARGISSDSGFNFKKVLSGVKDFLSVAKGIKGLFS